MTILALNHLPVIIAADTLLAKAVQLNASDLHLEADTKSWRVRLRIFGDLQLIATLTLTHGESLAARFKVLAKLDVTERRLPQDGQFYFADKNYQTDCRLSTCPTLHGEKLVLRLLNTACQSFSLNTLGLTDDQLTLCQQYLVRNQGLILVTGPTGSGKTITLYAMLRYLNQPEKNISTIEDPIEISLPEVNQISINPKLAFDFDAALRALLRQDPDVIMIGEIRDPATAKLALQAANTGHLVLASLHCNNASLAFRRLHSLGIAIDDLCQSVSLVLAQRLIRKRIKRQVYGRVGVFEILIPPKNIRYKTLTGFEKQLQQVERLTLSQSAQLKVAEGISEVEDVYEILQL